MRLDGVGPADRAVRDSEASVVPVTAGLELVGVAGDGLRDAPLDVVGVVVETHRRKWLRRGDPVRRRAAPSGRRLPLGPLRFTRFTMPIMKWNCPIHLLGSPLTHRRSDGARQPVTPLRQ